MKGSKHALNWTTLLIAIPVGCAASLVTLLFRETIEFINQLLFGRSNDITESLHLWPRIFWPVLVGVGGLLAGFFLRYAVAIEQQQTVKQIIWKSSTRALMSCPPKPRSSGHCRR